MKWLAVDYGDSRTGLAGCDAGETITSPITPQIEEKSMNKVAAAVILESFLNWRAQIGRASCRERV